MRPFGYDRAHAIPDALRAGTGAGAQYLAGGTVLLDLMKLDVMQPGTRGARGDRRGARGAGALHATGLHLGALARMAEVADHPEVARHYPALAQALHSAASPQLRNMASLAGTVLQRTRCSYFRDTRWQACNKRAPGTGCAAIGGVNRHLAVLGVSGHCIAHYPGDLATALVALGATVDLHGEDGPRSLLLEELHRLPGDTPHVETNLRPGELITGFHVPAAPWMRRSLYLKVRDRESYAFALASAAVALDLRDGIVREARIGLGGVATKPWRAHAAEAALAGRRFDAAAAEAAAVEAFRDRVVHEETGFKPELGRRTLVRALLDAAALEE